MPGQNAAPNTVRQPAEEQGLARRTATGPSGRATPDSQYSNPAQNTLRAIEPRGRRQVQQENALFAKPGKTPSHIRQPEDLRAIQIEKRRMTGSGPRFPCG